MISVLLLLGSLSFAQCPGSQPANTDCVAYGATKSVTFHSTCKSVTNNHASTKAIMIPGATSAEWASFYNNPPAGVTAGSCSLNCTAPWGATVNNGSSVFAYVLGCIESGDNCTNTRQTRTCTNGVLSGSYGLENCQVECCSC